MLIGRSPLRISFSGGGTDLEEYHKDFGGASISATIDKYTYVVARKRKDKLFWKQTYSQILNKAYLF